MNAQLERLWTYHEANADQAFRAEFARQPDSRFWEMYLTAHLIRARKKLLSRTEIARCHNGDKGPDIGVRKGKRVIWIEAIAPARGDRENLDEVPELVPAGTSQRLFRAAPRREVELRITGALYKKALIFRRYRADGSSVKRTRASLQYRRHNSGRRRSQAACRTQFQRSIPSAKSNFPLIVRQ
jgi:hypothetical protein